MNSDSSLDPLCNSLSNPLSDIRIVLSRTSHPGNIGAAARAMKTMGLSRLYLVQPRDFPSDEARARSSNAVDVLANAVVCSSLEEALSGTVMAAAMTARRRELTAPIRWARDGAAEIVAALGSKTGLSTETSENAKEVALVFGNEATGLTNEELGLCRIPITIPTNPDYASLNLGAAVQVMCYELRLAVLDPGKPLQSQQPEFEHAAFDDIQRLYAHLEEALTETGFLNPAQPKRLMPRLRRLFDRAGLEKDEVNILRGMLTSFKTPHPNPSSPVPNAPNKKS